MSAAEIVRLMDEEERTVLQAVESRQAEIVVAIERVAEAFQTGGRIVFVGAGHSGLVAAAVAAVMPSSFGVPAHQFPALVPSGVTIPGCCVDESEDDEHEAIEGVNHLEMGRADVMLAVGASGKTPFTLAATKHAKQKGVWVCAIVCNRRARVFDYADHFIALDTGPEVLTGATHLKAGTAQKLVLNRITLGAMVASGKVIENLMVDISSSTMKQRERCVRIVRDLTTATEEEARRLLGEQRWNVREVLERLREREDVGSQAFSI